MGMKMGRVAVVLVISAGVVTRISAQTHQNAVIDLWAQGKPAFGVYAPNEHPGPRGQRGQPPFDAAQGRPQPAVYTREGGEKLAMNPLYDYVFLNLEGSYDPDAVKAMSKGLHSSKATSRKTLLVRIPPISADGADAAKARVKEIFDAGADGVTIPHIRDIEEAKLALSFFAGVKADIWSPANPKGTKLAMLMLEDPKAISQRAEIANLPGISVLACGIGSLAQAIGGDREAARAGAEAGTQQVLVETKRVKIANMLTANAKDVETRVKEGFLALLMQGAAPDRAVTPTRTTPLFNGRDLSGWTADVPEKDTNPSAPDSFIVRGGMLVSLGTPPGHLLTTSRSTASSTHSTRWRRKPGRPWHRSPSTGCCSGPAWRR